MYVESYLFSKLLYFKMSALMNFLYVYERTLLHYTGNLSNTGK